MLNLNLLVLVNFVFLAITALALVVVLLDRIFWKQFKDRRYGKDPMVSFAYELLPIMLIIMILRTYVLEPYIIPSESMYPQLTKGDVIFVSKSSYNIKFPFTNYGLFDTGAPSRGEVAVFQLPPNPNEAYIKRIIGVPGDRLEWKDGGFFLNGSRVYREHAVVSSLSMGRYSWEVIDKNKYLIRNIFMSEAERFGLTSPYLLLKQRNEVGAFDSQVTELSVDVPDGYYFAVGDNRDQSLDSRYWGLVPKENLIGRPKWVVVHFKPDVPVWRFWEKVTFSRTKAIR